MAEPAKKKRRIKQSETVRERAAKSSESGKKTRRLSLPKSDKAEGKKRKEYHLPLPDNKVGRLAGKRVRFVPKYFREAWQELKLVHWPSRKETLKLTLAVFVFALVFGGMIWLVDYGLDNLFRKVLIG